MLGFLKNIGPTEWIVITLIVVILFGAKIATKLGRASGETLREIKKAKKSFIDAVVDSDSKTS